MISMLHHECFDSAQAFLVSHRGHSRTLLLFCMWVLLNNIRPGFQGHAYMIICFQKRKYLAGNIWHVTTMVYINRTSVFWEYCASHSVGSKIFIYKFSMQEGAYYILLLDLPCLFAVVHEF